MRLPKFKIRPEILSAEKLWLATLISWAAILLVFTISDILTLIKLKEVEIVKLPAQKIKLDINQRQIAEFSEEIKNSKTKREEILKKEEFADPAFIE